MWSIGIYSGESPFDLRPMAEACNPVLTRDDVRDVPARFVADPFMISSEGVWYMFFEVMNDLTDKGEIALATSVDCVNWDYHRLSSARSSTFIPVRIRVARRLLHDPGDVAARRRKFVSSRRFSHAVVLRGPISRRHFCRSFYPSL